MTPEREVPAGYRPAQTYGDIFATLICLNCGVLVGDADIHEKMHQRLYERLGGPF